MRSRRAPARRWPSLLAAAAWLLLIPCLASAQDTIVVRRGGSEAKAAPFPEAGVRRRAPSPEDVANAPADTSIPRAVGYVNDRAGLLDETTRAKLEAFLDQVQRKTGAQFAILTVTTTAPEDPETYKVRVFERWGIGGAEQDEGLLLLIALRERAARFETGYGLEGTLPDGLQSRIFREVMRPRFAEGDYATGLVEGVKVVAARIAAEKGVTLEWDGRELRYDGGGGDGPPLWVYVLIVIVIFTILSGIAGGGGFGGGRRRRRSGWGDLAGWGGGFGGGFGGGGFGGGGFGGGGSGGGSFGGFGGGSSGGGGGGGNW